MSLWNIFADVQVDSSTGTDAPRTIRDAGFELSVDNQPDGLSPLLSEEWGTNDYRMAFEILICPTTE